VNNCIQRPGTVLEVVGGVVRWWRIGVVVYLEGW
jgi:hypothetical protein